MLTSEYTYASLRKIMDLASVAIGVQRLISVRDKVLLALMARVEYVAEMIAREEKNKADLNASDR